MNEAENQKVYCEIVSPRNGIRCTHKVSLTWLPELKLSKDNPSRYTNVCRGELREGPFSTQRTTGN